MLLQLQVLTDTVENNDGCIDGVTHDRQHAGNECGTHRPLAGRIESQHYQHIMHQCQNGAGCEGNILEISGSSTESESHNYYQMDADGRTYIETVSYQYYPEVWIRQDGVDGEQVEITKSEFDAVVASYPRIALDMKPISEFPMP